MPRADQKAPDMLNAWEMQKGDRVVILIRAGAIERGEFVGVVEPGQLGLYVGPMAGKLGSEDWHDIAVGTWQVPLHRGQFRLAGIADEGGDDDTAHAP